MFIAQILAIAYIVVLLLKKSEKKYSVCHLKNVGRKLLCFKIDLHTYYACHNIPLFRNNKFMLNEKFQQTVFRNKKSNLVVVGFFFGFSFLTTLFLLMINCSGLCQNKPGAFIWEK